METFFKKYFWTAQVAFVVVAALLLAGAVSGFVSSAFADYSVAVPEMAGLDGAAPDLTEVEPPQTIPICAFGCDPPPPVVDLCAEVECEEDEECNSATGECEAVEAETEPEPSDGRCIESDIAINLVGTMVSDDDSWSLAILHNPSLTQTQFARVGTSLLAEAEVTRIERNRIFLLRNGQEECLRPGDQQERTARAAATRQRSTAAASSNNSNTRTTSTPSRSNPVSRNNDTAAPEPAADQTLEQRIAAQIERTDDGSYQVPRDLIQEVANNSSLMEQHAPRVVPNYVNGQPRGFRLQGIRSGSIFSAIGIRNGDVIVGVNGTEIDSPQRALELYQAMLQQDQVTMEILRRGRSQTIRYNIR